MAWQASCGVVLPDANDRALIPGDRPQQHCIYQREEHREDADAQRQRQDRDCGKSRAPDKSPRCVAEIARNEVGVGSGHALATIALPTQQGSDPNQSARSASADRWTPHGARGAARPLPRRRPGSDTQCSGRAGCAPASAGAGWRARGRPQPIPRGRAPCPIATSRAARASTPRVIDRRVAPSAMRTPISRVCRETA